MNEPGAENEGTAGVGAEIKNRKSQKHSMHNAASVEREKGQKVAQSETENFFFTQRLPELLNGSCISCFYFMPE